MVGTRCSRPNHTRRTFRMLRVEEFDRRDGNVVLLGISY